MEEDEDKTETADAHNRDQDEVVHYPEPDPAQMPAPEEEQVTQPEEVNEPGGQEEPITVDEAEPEPKKGRPSSKFERLKQWYLANKKLSIPLSVLALIIILAAIPATRYGAAGLVVRKDMTITVQDSKTHTPLSGARVEIGKVSATTNAAGHATLANIGVGHHTVSITKTYYASRSAEVLVPILKQKQEPSIALAATGRQVRITVTDLINQQPIAGAKILIDGSASVTDAHGDALAVVPAGVETKEVSISAKGFNDAKATVQVNDSEIKDTSVSLTPSGQVYFLSKLSGKVDVVKTNLDGSGRKTVLAGTGKEDDRNTILLASRDWQHLALVSSRDGSAKVYIINTDSDSLITMDQSDSDFTPIGWYDHYFVYTVSHHGYNAWQPNAFSIKSYNSDNGKILTLVNSNAAGSSNADAQYETIWQTQFVGEDLVYTRTWYKYPGYLQVDGKQNTLSAIRPDGTNNRVIKTLDAAVSYISNVRLNKPRELEFSVYNNSSNDSSTFILDKNGNVNQTNTDINFFNTPAISYLESPTSGQTFWQEQRDGKNTLFVGDQDAAGAKQVASLSAYNAYGWYSDKYLLASKNGSELYIMPASGISSDSGAKKITDYHKPALNFFGYGGGYGGQ
jgi:hypothetical protein